MNVVDTESAHVGDFIQLRGFGESVVGDDQHSLSNSISLGSEDGVTTLVDGWRETISLDTGRKPVTVHVAEPSQILLTWCYVVLRRLRSRVGSRVSIVESVLYPLMGKYWTLSSRAELALDITSSASVTEQRNKDLFSTTDQSTIVTMKIQRTMDTKKCRLKIEAQVNLIA
jgi:hypothetical protein